MHCENCRVLFCGDKLHRCYNLTQVRTALLDPFTNATGAMHAGKLVHNERSASPQVYMNTLTMQRLVNCTCVSVFIGEPWCTSKYGRE